MRKILIIGAIMAAMTLGVASAQNTGTSSLAPNTPKEEPRATQATPQTNGTAPAPGQTQPENTPRIAPGSVIPVQLTKAIDAKKAKSGDEVVAKVTQDMKTNTGVVLVPKDTKVIGHVTEAQARHKNEKESELAIAFNQAVLDNQPVDLPMSIQAVIGQQNNAMNAGGSPGGNPGAEPPPPSSAGTTQNSPMAGRSPMGSPGQPQPAPNEAPTPESQGNQRPPINAKTQGVIGISNLNLSPNSTSTQGSVLSSEKNNVKLESGTMLLLRVNK
ncbi:MAG: hypothetical protein WAM79_20760 [Candidatus Sulfotelmatobacter sp.]